MSKTLFLIPARGGSKGISKKNIKNLAGKPLIHYSLEIARKFVSDDLICVSTDDDEIKNVVEEFGIQVPFTRPAHLATDNSGSFEVVQHALNFYESEGFEIHKIVLLQPTSPLRKVKDVEQALSIYSDEVDMVVSVKKTDSNPYYLLYEEDDTGILHKSKELPDINRRQDAPDVYEINGAVYVINAQSLKEKKSFNVFSKKKSLMNKYSSVDIDDMLDWYLCELIIEKNLIE